MISTITKEPPPPPSSPSPPPKGQERPESATLRRVSHQTSQGQYNVELLEAQYEVHVQPFPSLFCVPFSECLVANKHAVTVAAVIAGNTSYRGSSTAGGRRNGRSCKDPVGFPGLPDKEGFEST
ncbi:hypothetical protein DEO72_LG9g3105 [Vigna unguiculata]|uniref:Uncharacterized protein n=1 Tax=Vigna unguiculata TaxID=3917 RepID=A0A4D6N5B2_VIGUN|nr:hypothetical protein DEO72_LG9g3105 [Vigna unguiculata]